ncbi:DUF6371 domain-containing protein [Spirosoma endophyticum]|uniref:Uncharacterized protein n=1 Tax=Spirosoma endophyticum TaxID=662367 RepID=A0A1I2H3A4_9BACT|nr:DUF6371 domain-containing protein [Spirosoma endophyticum]SFF23161.1 hypothetical protein SAMN05216167_1377 [Spirosoma endophyticum]
MPTNTFRYQLPKKAIKSDCPSCGPKHRKTLSRYIDTQTGELLPDMYGRCDRESNCGYHLNPYHKGASGLSYYEQMKAQTSVGPIPKNWFTIAARQKHAGLLKQNIITQLMQREGASLEQAEHVANFLFDKSSPSNRPVGPVHFIPTQPASPLCTIPEEVFTQSLGHYERNQFARLLRRRFGDTVANDLLNRFNIGTSGRWPGACVFWFIDEWQRIRGGQIKLFDDTFHTVNYVIKAGEKRSRTTWVHSSYARRCDELNQPYPAWLMAYLDERNEVQKSPCLFGLPQLLTADTDQPIAIVEAPKTAVISTPYFPGFIWMAVGALSYLNAERLAPLRGRRIELFPDLSKDGSAFDRWNRVAGELLAQGFQITVSTYLEDNATDDERAAGADLADFLLEQWHDYSSQWDE